jgi:endonuclease YncB( thermonuclease family)
MKRRQLLLGIGATVGAGAAISSGAFSNVSADRQLAVTVADDAAGLLSLAPAAGPNGEYVDDSGDRVAVQLGDSSAGLTEAARYEFDSTLHVGNQGTQPVYVWAELSSAAFAADELWVYPGDTTTPLNTANPVELEVGGGLDVGFYVDTSSVDTDTYSPTITLHASDEPPEGGAEPPQEPPEEPTEFVDELVFDSTSSLLADGTGGDEFGYLPAERVVVAAEGTAESTDADGNGDAVSYPDGEDLPLVAADGSVVAFGFPFAQDAVTFGPYGNEEVLLNVLDEYAGSGTVLWDEGHGQYYDLESHSSFAGYAGENGYTVEATSDVLVDLPSADAVVVTSPSDSFSDTEVDALSSFADDGGLVVLMDQSDYGDYDQTANLNDLAAGVGTTIRFNDNQVVDDQQNDGRAFVPVSSSFNTDDHASLLAAREGLGLDPAGEYEVDVVEVTDGDTMDVVIPDQDGIEETVRVVGIDTPETGSTDERIEEYEGITDEPALKDLADQATGYAEDHLAGETLTLSFDENEPARGDYGRLLGFLELPDGTVYNRQAVADGWARVYSSGFGDHDDYWDAEDAAQADGKGIWSISDPASIPESGDDPVDSLFFPSPVAVQGGSTVVASENGDPLVAVDESAGVAAVGGPLVDEGFEPAEGGDPSNDGQQVYPFVANLINYLADGTIAGPVLFDGGHGQFDSDFGLSAEDVAYFQRYLEGQSTATVDSIALEGTNDLTDDEGPALLDDAGDPVASALVVTAPVDEVTADERAAVADFAAAGGAVVLVGTARDTGALANFEDVVADLGTSVGFTGTAVTDGSNNLGGEPSLPTTTSFPGPDELFTAFTPEDGGGSSSASVEITSLDDSDEWVEFENTGSTDVDVTDWTLSDETTKTYTFPSTTLAPGETFVVTTNQTPSGAAPAADYTDNWDEGYVWNGGGDTATLSDADGTVVDTYSY